MIGSAHPAIGVDIHPLIVVADEQLQPVAVGERDDGVGTDATLDLGKQSQTI